MNAQQLRNSILQQAIQGKLVPQDPADEPASVLLQRIRKEKEHLVKEGKLKKKDFESKPIEEEEIPFEIPESWEWVRLVEIGLAETGVTPSKSHPEYFGTFIPFLGPANILNGQVVSETQGLSEIGVDYGRIVPKGTILQVCIGGSIGKCAIVDKPVTFNQQINSITPLVCNIKYICYVLQSNYFLVAIKEKSTGTATPIINRGNWEQLIFPLPPLAEQRRIVAKIEELMPLVERYGKAQQALDQLNESLPARLRQSILQEAIQGRLVPQDPKEEPASELLKHIRKEKERLVKEGRLKKKDLESKPIEEDEIPFEIPESWEWVRLKTITNKIVDGDHNPPRGLSYNTGYYMLSSKNINHNTIDRLDDVRWLSFEDWEKCHERTNLNKGDILLTTVATLGRSCVYEDNTPYCFQRSVSIISTYIYNYYLKYCFDCPYYQSLINDKATGTAQRGFYLNQLEESVIPLPPLSEQKRIVAKVEELFDIIKL